MLVLCSLRSAVLFASSVCVSMCVHHTVLCRGCRSQRRTWVLVLTFHLVWGRISKKRWLVSQTSWSTRSRDSLPTGALGLQTCCVCLPLCGFWRFELRSSLFVWQVLYRLNHLSNTPFSSNSFSTDCLFSSPNQVTRLSLSFHCRVTGKPSSRCCPWVAITSLRLFQDSFSIGPSGNLMSSETRDLLWAGCLFNSSSVIIALICYKYPSVFFVIMFW